MDIYLHHAFPEMFHCPINLHFRSRYPKMRLSLLLSVGSLAPITSFAAPASHLATHNEGLHARENLCNLKAPPVICQANSSVTVEETAQRAYKFYRAFVVDGDPRTMFSLIDSSYIVSRNSCSDSQCSDAQPFRESNDWVLNAEQQHHPGYASGPNAIWSLFCNGNKIGTEKSTAWCFDASTNMSYARYSTTDRWRWVDGCVHEHVGISIRIYFDSADWAWSGIRAKRFRRASALSWTRLLSSGCMENSQGYNYGVKAHTCIFSNGFIYLLSMYILKSILMKFALHTVSSRLWSPFWYIHTTYKSLRMCPTVVGHSA